MSAKAVEPAKIEDELAKIWDDLQGKNKMRACLFNLVIYAKKDQRAGYLQKIAEKLIQRFPSRIILVSEDDKSIESYLSSKVSVLSADEGSNGIFCDLIEIDVSGNHRKRVPSVILPHLLPDLPIYLLWGDDPTCEDPISFNLETFATRTIFDSETSDHLLKFVKSITAQRDRSHCDIADLNWGRIEGWRNLFASTFYSKEKIAKLSNAKSIVIEFNSKASKFYCHTTTQSIYFQAWIACRLGWKSTGVEKRGNDLIFNYGETSVTIVTGEMESLPPGRILSVDICLTESDHIKFERKPSTPHHVVIQECTHDICKIAAQHIFEKEESGKSLVNEICHQGTSKHFSETLDFILQINEEELF